MKKLLFLWFCVFSILFGGFNLDSDRSFPKSPEEKPKERVKRSQKELKIDRNKSFAENLKNLQISDEYKLDEIVIGDKNAPHTLIVYSSFSCSHCKKFHDVDFGKLQKYIQQKKLKIYLRNYLDDLGALEAAILMRIFYKKGKSVEKIYKAIFNKQKDWMNSQQPRQFLIDIFVSMGFSKKEVDQYLRPRNETYKRISAGLMKAQQEAMFSLGVDSVPAFVIDGKVYIGYLNANEISKKLGFQKHSKSRRIKTEKNLNKFLERK